jgi:hypothetical protein
MTDSVLSNGQTGPMADCPMILPMERHSNCDRSYFRSLLNKRFVALIR